MFKDSIPKSPCPQDFKPADWDEREKIPDPEAEKPADWDEDAPRQILDEDAEKPDGWLDDEPGIKHATCCSTQFDMLLNSRYDP